MSNITIDTLPPGSPLTGVEDIPMIQGAADAKTNPAAIKTYINALPISGGTLTGSLILNADPTVNLGAATKQYVDNASASASSNAARLATTGVNLTATYNNGTAGVGATLTNSGTQTAFTLDGKTGVVGDIILVKDQTSQLQNGAYALTNVGSGSTNWVLTRTTDTIAEGIPYAVAEGTVNAASIFIQTGTGPFTIGTTPIVFTPNIVASTGLQKTGNALSIANTAATAGSHGDAATVPAYTVNAQGQLTANSDIPIAIMASQVSNFSTAADARITNAIATNVVQQYNNNLQGFSNLNHVFSGPVIQGGSSGIPSYAVGGGGAQYTGTAYNNLSTAPLATYGLAIEFNNAAAKTVTLDSTGLYVGFYFTGYNNSSTNIALGAGGGSTVNGASICFPGQYFRAEIIENAGGAQWYVSVGKDNSNIFSNVLNISSNTTLSYPLPAKINCSTNAGSVTVKFPNLSNTPSALGQAVDIINNGTLSNVVNITDQNNSSIATALTSKQIGRFYIIALNPVTLDYAPYPGSGYGPALLNGFGVLGSEQGGTGVNNGVHNLVYNGDVTFSGNFNSTYTLTGTTNVTFPTSGTLATTAAYGAINGVATLNGSAYLTTTQFPALTGDVTTAGGSLATTINPQKLRWNDSPYAGTSYPLGASDSNAIVRFTNSAGCAVTLATGLTIGTRILLVNQCGNTTGFVTLILNGNTINYQPKVGNGGYIELLYSDVNTYTVVDCYCKYVQSVTFALVSGGGNTAAQTITTTQIKNMVFVKIPSFVTSFASNAYYLQSNTAIPIPPLSVLKIAAYVYLSGTTYAAAQIQSDTGGTIYFLSATGGAFSTATSINPYETTLSYSMV